MSFICYICFLLWPVFASIDYKDRSYNEIIELLLQLNKTYPDIVELYTAQERYGLESPGDCGSEQCLQYVAVLTEKRTLTDDRPEVFFSGALHGNERVGPNAVVETLRLLCVSYDLGNNAWLKRLVQTRVIVLIPMTNAWGYYHKNRMEQRYDPNRDFPINKKPRDCMVSITARTVNEVYREHLFQLALTFHSGMRSIAFEWGTYDHKTPKDISPDHNSQYGICQALSEWAGKKHGQMFYPFGTLNRQVYPVNGGMEDWGYASSWQDKLTGSETLKSCTPKTYGGYSPEKTVYNDAVLRCFNILIEASDGKIPPNRDYGSSKELLSVDGTGNGDGPRNIRLILLTTDLVQPYVILREPQLSNVDGKLRAELKWEVGGALHVDESEILYSQSGEQKQEDWIVKKIDVTGSTFFEHPKEHDEMGDVDFQHPGRGVFEYTLDLEAAFSVDYWFQVRVKVDQKWGEQPAKVWPDVPIQSHAANARTNPEWFYENNGHKVQGRLWWNSSSVRGNILGPTEHTQLDNQGSTEHTQLDNQGSMEHTQLDNQGEAPDQEVISAELPAITVSKQARTPTPTFVTPTFVKRSNASFREFLIHMLPSTVLVLFVVIGIVFLQRRKNNYVPIEQEEVDLEEFTPDTELLMPASPRTPM